MKTIAVVFVLFVLGFGVAFAGDDGETIQEAQVTIAAVEKAQKANDRSGLESAFVRLIELHNGLEGEKWRQKLQSAAGAVLKDKKCPELHDAAVSALESLDDGDGVFKQLKPVLPHPKDVEVSELGVYAVGVVGIVKSPHGIRYLATLAAEGHHVGSRVTAVKALSEYRKVDKANAKALDGLLTALVKSKPGVDAKDDQREAWIQLETPLVRALNALTFKDLESADLWVAWYRKNKGKLREVFAGVVTDDE